MNYSQPHNINTLSKCCLKFIKGGLWEIPGVSDLFHCINKRNPIMYLNISNIKFVKIYINNLNNEIIKIEIKYRFFFIY